MEQKRFINLLHRQLTDQLDQQDEVRLKDWMEDDSANEDLASRIAEAWKASESYAPDFDPSVEQGLSRLKGRIAAAKEADKKAPTLTVRSRSLFLRIAVAATLAFGLFGLWQYTSQSSGEVWQVAQTNAQKGDAKLLSDGTVVSINSNTKLEFPEEFKNTERRVRLDGEAFFDVARDTEHPFIIEMEGATVKVLGT
ncbi:MAG: FecR family protein, partial [Bacteroidota bacterium]